MFLSIKVKLNGIFILALLFVLISTVVFAFIVFKDEISSLYRNDLSERLRLVETDYTATDAVAGASEDVEQIQSTVLENLTDKYMQLSDSDLSPFIVNGDGEIILSLNKSFLEQLLTSSAGAGIINQSDGEMIIPSNEGNQWIIYNYFEEWDWYTGYILADRNRLESVRSFTKQIVMIILGISVVMIFIVTRVTGSIVSRMRIISEHTGLILEGHLEQRIETGFSDEVGNLAGNFNTFTNHLQEIIRGIQSSRSETGQIKDRLNTVVARTAGLMENINSQTGEISGGILELNQSIQASGDSLLNISGQVDDLNEKAEKQVQTVSDSSRLIGNVGKELTSLSENLDMQKNYSSSLVTLARDGQIHLGDTNRVIQEMNNNISEIVGLVEIIQSIADQTNLLAMNAAIEAAHAGESGKGFAVVADEIRKLATQSSENSKSIDDRISRIVDRAKGAFEAGQQTEQTFESILSRINDVSSALDDASGSTVRMADQFNELDDSISHLSASAGDVKSAAGRTENELPVIQEGISRLESIGRDVLASISSIDESTSRQVSNIGQVSSNLDDLQNTIDTLRARISVFSDEKD